MPSHTNAKHAGTHFNLHIAVDIERVFAQLSSPNLNLRYQLITLKIDSQRAKHGSSQLYVEHEIVTNDAEFVGCDFGISSRNEIAPWRNRAAEFSVISAVPFRPDFESTISCRICCTNFATTSHARFIDDFTLTKLTVNGLGCSS